MKALIFLIPEGFRDEEFSIPKDRLQHSGITVVVAGLQPGKARGVLGMTATPDILLDEVKVDNYDAFIVPGGPSSLKYLLNNEKVLSILKEAYSKNKIIAAICLSGAVLANAGILEGKKATVFETPETLRIFKEKGVIHVDQQVVVDGSIVTGDGPQAAVKFADEILKLLKTK